MGRVPTAVQALFDAGLQVLPVRAGEKTPALKSWKRYQTERVSPELLRAWWRTDRGVFVITGRISGVVVLDIDSDEGEATWRDQLGELLDQTSTSTTGKGRHYWFRCKSKVRSSSGPGWDLRAEGTGVIAPPSMHASGVAYKWVRGLEHLQEWPTPGSDNTEANEGGRGGTGARSGRSRLVELLTSPPDVGGRNTWLTAVAGHYAKAFRDKQDAYEVLVRRAVELMPEPLPEHEIAKTIESVWSEEQQRKVAAVDAEATGYLVEYEGRLWGVTHAGERGREFADFTIHARGHAEGIGWLVDLSNQTHAAENVVLSGGILSDRKRLDTVLAGHRLTLGPGADVAGYGRPGARLIRLMNAQGAPTIRSMPCFDWSEDLGGFCIDGGIIKPGAARVVEAPILTSIVDRGAWHYGFKSGAQEILREVMSWHDEVVTVVFGAWWAACFVRFWVDQHSSQFPFMALRAPSESGKSTGFFPAMIALNGNRVGKHDSTPAALRDSLAANRAGIVWIDDSGHPDLLRDLIRQATVGGSMRKKDQDMGQASARLVAPLVMSGESIGIVGEKALLDRAIMLEVPTPKHRVDSRTGKLQWNRIVEVMTQNPDMTEYAGALMARALECRQAVEMLPDLRMGAGREADKWAILRVGLLLLEEMLGEPVVEGRGERILEDWIVEHTGVLVDENALTLDYLPTALSVTGWQRSPLPATGREAPTPVLALPDGTVAFNAYFLETWLRKEYGRTDPRVASKDSIIQQAKQLGLRGTSGTQGGDMRLFRAGASERAWYWVLPESVSTAVLDRSHSGHTDMRVPGGQGEMVHASQAGGGSPERVTRVTKKGQRHASRVTRTTRVPITRDAGRKNPSLGRRDT